MGPVARCDRPLWPAVGRCAGAVTGAAAHCNRRCGALCPTIAPGIATAISQRRNVVWWRDQYQNTAKKALISTPPLISNMANPSVRIKERNPVKNQKKKDNDAIGIAALIAAEIWGISGLEVVW